MNNRSTVNPLEIRQFDDLAGQWWDEEGPFKPLHRLTPARMRYLVDQITARYGKVAGLSILDVGCGGGLVCEPLARLGAAVTGLDGGHENIAAAKNHAAGQDLTIEYQASLAEDWLAKGHRYDVVLALEIIEHVADPAYFVETCLKLLKPSGLIIFSTLNRNRKSYALGIVAAEYILRWVPKGTHNWRQFVKPSELAGWLRDHAVVTDITGLVYNPVTRDFSLSAHDVDVNYFLTATK